MFRATHTRTRDHLRSHGFRWPGTRAAIGPDDRMNGDPDLRSVIRHRRPVVALLISWS
jgi:hypothetical protein